MWIQRGGVRVITRAVPEWTGITVTFNRRQFARLAAGLGAEMPETGVKRPLERFFSAKKVGSESVAGVSTSSVATVRQSGELRGELSVMVGAAGSAG